MLHPKSIHFPSGYPMTHSPPLFVCSSPGPDPYRSHDNVYEELAPPRDSDIESEPPAHSDDDFAEDELSLPGDRSFQKLSPSDGTTAATTTPSVSTIYHERGTASTASTQLTNERNSIMSSGSSNNNERLCGGSTTTAITTSPSTVTTNTINGGAGTRSIASPDLGGLFRSNRRGQNNRIPKPQNYSADELNTSSELNASDILPTIYDDRNLRTLPYRHNHNINCSSNISNSTNLNNINNNNNNNINHNNHNNTRSNTINSPIDCNSDVERRNQINNQLSQNQPTAVSTIFRGRTINCNGGSGRGGYISNHTNHNHHTSNHRSRTNPRSLDRRRIGGMPPPHDQSYGYAEPMFHEGILYDACLSHQLGDRNHLYPYLLPEFTTFRTMNGAGTPNEPGQPIYSRDSSFGSDSGYSHHTQGSNRGGGSSSGGAGNGGGNTGIGCGWSRRKLNTNNKNGTYEGS